MSKRALIAGLLFARIASALGIVTPATASEPVLSGAVPVNVRRVLTLAERVAHQYAIEEVYWRHRTWPKDNPEPKPPVGAMISREQMEKKVADYLRQSLFVTNQRGSPMSASELQAEMDRMANDTKRPEVLRELFAALGNDPFVIAECLARPILAERLAAGSGVVAGVSPAPTSLSPADTALSTVDRTWVTTNVNNVQYKLPQISIATGCTDDTWTATSTTGAPDGRIDYTAVWTGSEMIVWGGFNFSPPYFLNTGGRYNPAIDSWIGTSAISVPTARGLHTAIWTGSEMIVWGGYNNGNDLQDGGRYNPAADTWVAISTVSAPVPREQHSVVWSGTEMIVWGGLGCGSNCRLNSGGRYNPSIDSWTATSTINAPEARWLHTAAWTGREMIIWGGSNQTIYLKTGAKYDPTDNSWTPTSTVNAPLGRVGHTTIWSGSEMMVWGGADSTFHDTNTGGRYNPTADSWSVTSTSNAPSPRDSLAAVWTGNEMIVWGGVFCCPGIDFDTGGRYDPGTDTWTTTSTANAPFARWAHTAVWTGSEMIVWGGFNLDQIFFNTGARYCAAAPAPFTLSASKRKIGGINAVRLTWSGATSTEVDVYRDGVVIVTTANDGSFTDSTGDTGRARYTYQVCEAGTAICSDNARVTFRQ